MMVFLAMELSLFAGIDPSVIIKFVVENVGGYQTESCSLSRLLVRSLLIKPEGKSESWR